MLQVNKRRLLASLRVPGFIIHLGIERIPYKPIIVVTNETEDNMFLPFLDYDNIHYFRVIKDIKKLQYENTGPAIILPSKEEGWPIWGNYHIMFLSKWPYHQIKDFQMLTRCDRGFMKKGEKRKHCALRVSAKGERERPWFKEIIPGRTTKECSLAHYLMLKKLHNIPDLEGLKFDSFTKATMASDMTAG